MRFPPHLHLYSKNPNILLSDSYLTHRPLATSIKFLNRAFGWHSASLDEANLRKELFEFLAVFFQCGGTLEAEHHAYIAKTVKAYHKVTFELAKGRSESKEPDFAWLHEYISQGLIHLKGRQEGDIACLELCSTLSVIFKKHWQPVTDVATFFDCLRSKQPFPVFSTPSMTICSFIIIIIIVFY